MRDQIEVTRKDLGGHERRLNFIYQTVSGRFLHTNPEKNN